MGNEEQAKAALAKKRAEAEERKRELALLEEGHRDVPPGIEATSECDPRNWNIWQKMFYIQQNLKVGKNRGKGHGGTVGYEYRNAQDILEGVKPLLSFTRTIVQVSVVPDMIGVGAPVESKVIGKDKHDNEILVRVFGPRFVAKATARLIDTTTGFFIEATSFAEIDCWRKGQTEPEKLSGSADSYASKYALAHLFGLDDGKDADGEGDKPVEQPW